MVLLGIDPGLAATGYGVVRLAGPRVVRLDHGCLRTSAQQDMGERLATIHTRLLELIREHRPVALAMEQLYQLRDGSTGLAVGQAIGVIRLAAQQQGLAVHEYTPTHVKMTLLGYGQADKAQVQFMVQKLLGLDELPRPDHAADALALCICHAQSGLSRARALAASPGPAAGRIAAALAAEQARREAHLRGDVGE